MFDLILSMFCGGLSGLVDCGLSVVWCLSLSSGHVERLRSAAAGGSGGPRLRL